MPGQKGSALPLIIFGAAVVILIGAAFYFMGVFKSPQTASDTPKITPPLSTPAPSGPSGSPGTASPAVSATPSGYANPFTEDDSYENPFNNL